MRVLLRLMGAACAVGAATGAAAQVGPYYIGGLVSYGYQSNVLGLADNTAVPPGRGYTSKSDRITSVALIGGLDQPIGRQRLFGDVTVRDNRYAENDLLDHRSYALNAGVDWQTIRRISGNVTVKANRDLVSYGTFEQPTGTKNLVTTKVLDTSARIGGVTKFTFEGGFNLRALDYTGEGFESRNSRQQSASLGFRYWPSGTNYAGLGVRATNGRLPKFARVAGGGFQEDEFDRRDLDATLSLQSADISSILTRVSYSKIDYDLQNNLDFSGFTGSLRADWQPTGKVRLSSELARDRGQDLLFTLDNFGTRVESARLATAVRARAVYVATAKIELNTSVGYTRRSVNAVNSLFGFVVDGRENQTQFGIGASWAPTRYARVGCDVARDRRRSDVAAEQLNVTSNSATCFGQITLQP